jgi:hypothetical protein
MSMALTFGGRRRDYVNMPLETTNVVASMNMDLRKRPLAQYTHPVGTHTGVHSEWQCLGSDSDNTL